MKVAVFSVQSSTMLCPSLGSLPYARRRPFYTTWFFVGLLTVLSFICGRSQQQSLKVLREDPAGHSPPPGNSAEEMVAVATVGDVPDLDSIDPTRYVRVLGKTNTLAYTEAQAVEAISLVVYFHKGTDEQVSLIVEGQARSELKSSEQEGKLADSGPCITGSVPSQEATTVCRIEGSDWYQVTWPQSITGCTKDITLRLSGMIPSRIMFML